MFSATSFDGIIPTFHESHRQSLEALGIQRAVDSNDVEILPENVLNVIRRFIDRIIRGVEDGKFNTFIVPTKGGLLLYYLLQNALKESNLDTKVKFIFARKTSEEFGEIEAGGRLKRHSKYRVGIHENRLIDLRKVRLLDDIYDTGAAAESIYYALNKHINITSRNEGAKLLVLSASKKALTHREFIPERSEFSDELGSDTFVNFKHEWILGSFGMNGSTKVPEEYGIPSTEIAYMEFLERTCYQPLKKFNPAIALFGANDQNGIDNFYKYVQILEEFNMFGRCREDIQNAEFFKLYMEMIAPEN